MTADPTFGRLLPIPKKMAIVFGTESVGCSDTMLAAADKVRQYDRERATGRERQGESDSRKVSYVIFSVWRDSHVHLRFG